MGEGLPRLRTMYLATVALAYLDAELEQFAVDVCNAIKLSQFTAVKMSHPRLVVSSLFAEILTV